MDRHIIAAGIAARQHQLARIEERLVSACERAAGHGRHGRRPPEDRGAWNRHTWDRYLREAVLQERELGSDLRRLHSEIAVLGRLSSLFLPARSPFPDRPYPVRLDGPAPHGSGAEAHHHADLTPQILVQAGTQRGDQRVHSRHLGRREESRDCREPWCGRMHQHPPACAAAAPGRVRQDAAAGRPRQQHRWHPAPHHPGCRVDRRPVAR